MVMYLILSVGISTGMGWEGPSHQPWWRHADAKEWVLVSDPCHFLPLKQERERRIRHAPPAPVDGWWGALATWT